MEALESPFSLTQGYGQTEISVYPPLLLVELDLDAADDDDPPRPT